MDLIRQSVLGIPVVACSFAEAMKQIEVWAIAADRPYGITFADASNITRGRHEPDYGACLLKLDAVMPDGMPVLWGVNRHLSRKEKLKERVSGPDMFRRLQEQSAEGSGIRHFYLGGSDDLLGAVVDTARRRCPHILIAGCYSPPFKEWDAQEMGKMFKEIRDSAANIIWVGLGCPKQERWIADNLAYLPPGVYLGVGAAFAFYTGNVKRAPKWMQKCGIEWVHRLMSEPRRLWKRYFVYNTLFVYYSLLELVTKSRPTPLDPA